jgi:DNA-binding response OmpR family regulator
MPGRAKSLVVAIDDDPMVLGLIEAFLSDMDVRSARGGPRGLALLADTKPDLILLDVNMPEVDGMATLRSIRRSEHLRYTPVLMLTARADRQTISEAMGLGADGYMIKPFTGGNLIKRARHMIGRVSLPEGLPR